MSKAKTITKSKFFNIMETPKLTKLGKAKKPDNYFTMKLDGLGLTVTCKTRSRTFTYYNVNVIEWLSRGEQVYMSSNHHTLDTNKAFDLSMFEEVTITKAKTKSDWAINRVMRPIIEPKGFDLLPQDWEDIKQAVYMAMQENDRLATESKTEEGRTRAKSNADRFEKLHNKV